MTTDKELQTVENASCALSPMPTSSLISNSNSVIDDSDEEIMRVMRTMIMKIIPWQNWNLIPERATDAFSQFLTL